MKLGVILAFSVLSSFPATAQDRPVPRMQERFNVGGYIEVRGTTPHTFYPHASPLPLSKAADTKSNRDAAKAAERYMNKADYATGLIMIDHGKIVYETYKGMGNRTSEFYSMSIAKSLTSLAVGKALCNGVLKSLEMRASKIVPETKINSLGQSTVRQLLMMSSGVWLTSRSGQPKFTGGLGRRPKDGKIYGGPTWPMRLGQMTVEDYLWGFGWERAENKNHAEPGQVFVYKAADTMTLGKILERATGMSLATYFDKHVWQFVRAKKAAHWEADKDGSTIASWGFQATLRDWGRIAIWILEQVKKPGCFGDYLRQATTTQIKNPRLGSGAGRSFDGYGYQWWTDNQYAPGFWGKGYAGQDLAINPKTNKILLKFSYRSTSGIYKVFRNWNRPKYSNQ
jgi:CubicO group peptidase (beta-lactamase class C family)